MEQFVWETAEELDQKDITTLFEKTANYLP